MFGSGKINFPDHLPDVYNYATAEQFYNEVTPWRKLPEWGHRRPLAATRKEDKTIKPVARDDGDYDYACIHHETELVRFCKDGRVKVRCWDSKVSRGFINHLLDWLPVRFDFYKCDYFSVFWVKFEGTWHVVDHDFELVSLRGAKSGWAFRGEGSVRVPRYPIKKVKAALRKHRVPEFQKFAKATFAMGGAPDWREFSDSEQVDLSRADDLIAALKDENTWLWLCAALGDTYRAVTHQVRVQVRNYEGVKPHYERVTDVDSGHKVRAVCRRKKQYEKERYL